MNVTVGSISFLIRDSCHIVEILSDSIDGDISGDRKGILAKKKKKKKKNLT